MTRTKEEKRNWFVWFFDLVAKLEERHSKTVMAVALLAVLTPLEIILINANGYVTEL